MSYDKKEVARAILNLISTQDFSDWYERGGFNAWLEGDEDAPADSEILHWIATHLR